MGVRIHTVWVTSISDRAGHAVTDEDMVAGMANGSGVYAALCGAEFLAAPMVVPPGPHCSQCVAFLRARETLRNLDQPVSVRRHRRPGLLARLLGMRSE